MKKKIVLVFTFLSKLNNIDTITDELHSKLYVSGSPPGILYGLVKVHKDQTFDVVKRTIAGGKPSIQKRELNDQASTKKKLF